MRRRAAARHRPPGEHGLERRPVQLPLPGPETAPGRLVHLPGDLRREPPYGRAAQPVHRGEPYGDAQAHQVEIGGEHLVPVWPPRSPGRGHRRTDGARSGRTCHTGWTSPPSTRARLSAGPCSLPTGRPGEGAISAGPPGGTLRQRRPYLGQEPQGERMPGVGAGEHSVGDPVPEPGPPGLARGQVAEPYAGRQRLRPPRPARSRAAAPAGTVPRPAPSTRPGRPPPAGPRLPQPLDRPGGPLGQPVGEGRAASPRGRRGGAGGPARRGRGGRGARAGCPPFTAVAGPEAEPPRPRAGCEARRSPDRLTPRPQPRPDSGAEPAAERGPTQADSRGAEADAATIRPARSSARRAASATEVSSASRSAPRSHRVGAGSGPRPRRAARAASSVVRPLPGGPTRPRTAAGPVGEGRELP